MSSPDGKAWTTGTGSPFVSTPGITGRGVECNSNIGPFLQKIK